MSFGLMSTTDDELMTVRQQIAVAQDDALRRAFRSRREEHDRRIVGALAVDGAASPASDRTSARRAWRTIPISLRMSSRYRRVRLRPQRCDQRLAASPSR